MATTRTPGWALYLRVSTEDAQTPERSFSMQKTEIEERLLTDSDLPLIETYRDIMTGKTFDRSGFNNMLLDARAGLFSHLAIYRVDRFGRDTAEGLSTGKELRRMGVRVIPASNPSLDITSPDGWMMWTILLGLGEHEVDVLRKRTRDGMRDKLLRGHWCWIAPDGYVNRRRQLSAKKSESWVEIDPDRAPIIREAWDLLLTGEYSYEQICDALHARGYTRNNGRPYVWYKSGKKNHASATLGRMFHNPLYAGWIVSDGYDIAWGEVRSQAGAIVTDAEWMQAQRILETNSRTQHNTKHNYLLQGMLYLTVDGEEIPMHCSTTVRESRGYDDISYYKIKRKHMGAHAFKGYYLPADDVEAAVAGLLDAISVAPDALPALREAYRAEARDAVEESLEMRTAVLKRNISDLLEQEKHYARLYAQGRLSDDAFDALAIEARADLATAQVQLSRIERGAGDRIRDLDRAVDILQFLPQAWELWSFRERREAVRLLFRKIVVDVEGELARCPLHTPFAYLRARATRVTAKPDGDDAPSGSTGVLFGTPERNNLEPQDVLAATDVERPELLYRLKLPPILTNS